MELRDSMGFLMSCNEWKSYEHWESITKFNIIYSPIQLGERNYALKQAYKQGQLDLLDSMQKERLAILKSKSLEEISDGKCVPIRRKQ